MKLSKKKAKEFSIKKWEWIVENNGSGEGLVKYIPELMPLLYECGLCEKYFLTSNNALEFCAKCPIRPKVKNYDYKQDAGCRQECHLYYKWCKYPTKENAQIILDLIKNI